jgi:hypothetical protein
MRVNCRNKLCVLEGYEMKTERYIVKVGKWGAYFYDTIEDHDLTLNEVKVMLNHLNRLITSGEKLK